MTKFIDRTFEESSPPYGLGGLLILSFLSLGVNMGDVNVLTDHLKTLFPALGGTGLAWRVQLALNKTPTIFGYLYGQNEEKRILNVQHISSHLPLMDKTSTDDDNTLPYIPTIYAIISAHGFDLRLVNAIHMVYVP